MSSSVTPEQITSNYLLNDFSNVSLKQELNTHNILNRGDRIVGFDSILKFVNISSENGTRWFRLWSSGFLEHGGTISCERGNVLSVKLDWKYGTNPEKTAITYDYPVKYDGFYAYGYSLCVDNTKIDIDQDNIGY